MGRDTNMSAVQVEGEGARGKDHEVLCLLGLEENPKEKQEKISSGMWLEGEVLSDYLRR